MATQAPPTPAPKVPKGRQRRTRRVTWLSDGSHGEVLRETFHRSKYYCMVCGTRGTWDNGDTDEGRHVCAECGTVHRLNGRPKPASGFWATILEQLRA